MAAQGSLVFSPNPALAGPPAANYARTIILKHNGANNGQLLTTFESGEKPDNGKATFPIYRSKDNNGNSWNFVTHVRDTQFGMGNRSQPMLFELPQNFTEEV